MGGCGEDGPAVEGARLSPTGWGCRDIRVVSGRCGGDGLEVERKPLAAGDGRSAEASVVRLMAGASPGAERGRLVSAGRRQGAKRGCLDGRRRRERPRVRPWQLVDGRCGCAAASGRPLRVGRYGGPPQMVGRRGWKGVAAGGPGRPGGRHHGRRAGVAVGTARGRRAWIVRDGGRRCRWELGRADQSRLASRGGGCSRWAPARGCLPRGGSWSKPWRGPVGLPALQRDPGGR